MVNRLCCGKLETLSYASGPSWGLTKQNFDKNVRTQVILLRFLCLLVSTILCEANKSTLMH